jgi:hypothetical protein
MKPNTTDFYSTKRKDRGPRSLKIWPNENPGRGRPMPLEKIFRPTRLGGLVTSGRQR